MAPTADKASKIIYWSKLLSQFASVQLAVQALGLLSGFMLIRVLDTRQYAFYTIANTLQSAIILLADVGNRGGLSPMGGRVWNDPFRFGQLINTALHLRRTLSVVILAVIAPMLLWMLLANGASMPYALAITAAVSVAASMQVTNGVLSVIPRLHVQVSRVQKLDLVSAVLRLLLLTAMYLLLMNAFTAIIAALATVWLQNLVLGRWAGQLMQKDAPVNEEDKGALWSIIKTQAPNDIYYCLQGQLTVWLITIFGNTKSIAEIGALGRLVMIFAILATTMRSVILPRFARCQSPALLRRRYWQILAAHIAFGFLLVAFAYLFPRGLLFVLGKKYDHLQNEVVLIMVSAVMNSILTAIFSLNASKAWFPPAWINIGSTTLVQIVLLVTMDISTVHGVIIFNILSLIPALLTMGWVSYSHLRSRAGEATV